MKFLLAITLLTSFAMAEEHTEAAKSEKSEVKAEVAKVAEVKADQKADKKADKKAAAAAYKVAKEACLKENKDLSGKELKDCIVSKK